MKQGQVGGFLKELGYSEDQVSVFYDLKHDAASASMFMMILQVFKF